MNSNIVQLYNEKEHDDFIRKNNRSVIFFGSQACGHCRQITPVVQKLANNTKNVVFGHVETNILDVVNLAGVPTFVMYYNQEPIDMVIGANESALSQSVTNLAKPLPIMI